ncbi:phosphatase PAP2 family protein [Halanaerobium kushneri]|jgi:undecaprenyl-diphosphatase|uniref:Undecaprenyl-diphosphatase n=1 Tax=Halanaerobium kushneri TaxID=56779 RepID=A0A1N7BCG5_9FIRM|nr:phosphatase PAP2 family protein [Halanaerobium kushneri]SIR49012.1 undecaprenyl-diphosphatase [Halanaerobium kushneri]
MLKKIDQKIFYILYNFTVSHEFILELAVFITKFSSKFFSVIYFAVGGWLIYNKDARLKAFILIPAAVYLIVKVIPTLYNRQRPFAEFKLKSLVEQREDHSFPSTHTASSLIISLAVLNISLELGILMTIMAVITALTRIMVGVHYPSDIIGSIIIVLTVKIIEIKYLF